MDNARRSSRKRQAIYDAVCSTQEHPSAEQIYIRLKPDYPDLSLGTVYRNIGVLIDEGRIKSVGKVMGEERYDAEMSAHAHFVCVRCGAVIDIPLPEQEISGYEEIGRQLGAKVLSHSLSFTGLCAECREKE